MKITIIKPNELNEVMQNVNLLKVKFGSKDVWIVAPMLFATEAGTDFVVNLESLNDLHLGEDVIIKFQRGGYEYIVSGEVTYIGSENPAVVSMKLIMAQRHTNLRKHMRFDTDLKVTMQISDGQIVESRAKNISRGGAMIVSKADLELNDIIIVYITFTSQNRFTAEARVLRKSLDQEDGFSYGIQFVGISEDDCRVFNKEILKYEKEYLKTIDILKEYTNKNNTYFNTKISILCYDADESYGIREVLVKMGAENFDVLHNFKFYHDFFIEENPKVVVVDSEGINDEIAGVLHQINESFPDIKIILLIPLDGTLTDLQDQSFPKGVGILYKPLICDEFEKEIIKYL